MSDYFNATGTIGFTCDVCGRELQGCTWVNGMRFCAKCYQETFGNTNPFEKELRDKIADLEAKLAESEERYKKAYQEGLLQKQFDKDMEIDQLKQQLAEKEKSFDWLHEKYAKYVIKAKKEIEELKEVKEIIRSSPSMLVGLDINSPITKKAKTDFAIAQLEKVKGTLEENRNDAQELLKPIKQEDCHELIGLLRGYRNSIYEVQKLITELSEGK